MKLDEINKLHSNLDRLFRIQKTRSYEYMLVRSTGYNGPDFLIFDSSDAFSDGSKILNSIKKKKFIRMIEAKKNFENAGGSYDTYRIQEHESRS